MTLQKGTEFLKIRNIILIKFYQAWFYYFTTWIWQRTDDYSVSHQLITPLYIRQVDLIWCNSSQSTCFDEPHQKKLPFPRAIWDKLLYFQPYGSSISSPFFWTLTGRSQCKDPFFSLFFWSRFWVSPLLWTRPALPGMSKSLPRTGLATLTEQPAQTPEQRPEK